VGGGLVYGMRGRGGKKHSRYGYGPYLRQTATPLH
jgi:hypothetical protein